MADSAKPSVLKQLLGAVVGMTAALALYMGYKTAAPLVTAYILPPGVTDPSQFPQGVSTGAEIDEDSEKYQRIGARTREIAERLGAAEEQQETDAAPAWIGGEEETHEAAPLPEPDAVEPVAAATAMDLQDAAAERRERREFAASLTASPVQAKPAAPAAPAASETKKAETKTVAAAQADATHAGAPNLPSSGRATNALAVVVALAATAALHRRSREQLLAWARAVR